MEHFNNLSDDVQQKAIEIVAYQLFDAWWENSLGSGDEYYAEERLMSALKGEKGFDKYFQEWSKEQQHAH